MNAIEKFRKGFTDIFDSHGKFKKHYVENLEVLAVKSLAKIEELEKKDCNKCKHKYDGTYTMTCFGCREYYASQFKEV